MLKTIFLVDDDQTNLEVGNSALEGYYDVFTFNSGVRLLKILEKNFPDLILLDIDMPVMNGYEVIKQIKNNSATAHIPVIFLTAKSDGESELDGLSLGAVDYISKPFLPALLRKRVELHLLLEAHNNNLQQMVDTKTKTVVELQNAVLKTMAELVECRDNITGGHIDRTQGYLRILLNALILSGRYENETSKWDLDLVMQSGQLHDVGKIAIKDGILKKPGKLTNDEFEEIKSHTVFGNKVIQKIMESTTEQEFLEYASIFAISHHEKWNGSGYPFQLEGDMIPLSARIVTIADVYDALRMARSYKPSLSHEVSVSKIIEQSGTHFDPRLVEVFKTITDDFAKIYDENAD
jgi:putative two-component system response regulator